MAPWNRRQIWLRLFNHGLIAINLPYVFEGSNPGTGCTKICEKLELSNNKWVILPLMRETICSFNPCMLLRAIYLCGWGSGAMEAFAPQTDTFSPLNITIPQATACCMWKTTCWYCTPTVTFSSLQWDQIDS